MASQSSGIPASNHSLSKTLLNFFSFKIPLVKDPGAYSVLSWATILILSDLGSKVCQAFLLCPKVTYFLKNLVY